jgi:perosamine synthetase
MGFIPYGRQWIDGDDIAQVVNVLRSDWLTTGPMVDAFEKAVADFVGAKYAVALSNGTAALHAAMYAIGNIEGAEVLVPPMTFAATANSVLYQGGKPVFVDVKADNLLIDPDLVQKQITKKTKAIIAVDYAGHPCAYDELNDIAHRNGLVLVSDACHALGAKYDGKNVGSLVDLTAFSFHPVKHITTGEGGMVVTDNLEYATRMRRFRNHGISTDHRQRANTGTWYYEMVDLGYNYRLTDIQCALGISQLRKLPSWVLRRREIAKRYDEAFVGNPYVMPLKVSEKAYHAYHLYVVELNIKQASDRENIFSYLRDSGIGVNVHYIPVHLHPYYRSHFGTSEGLCPVAEAAYKRVLSLPMFPALTDQDVSRVITAVEASTELLKRQSE